MPVKGGFEQNGTELFHAVAVIDGVKVPGKTGIHLVRATFLFWTNTFHFELLMNAGQILMMMHVSSGWLQRPLRRTRARCERGVWNTVGTIHFQFLAIAHHGSVTGAGNSRLATLRPHGRPD
jgi:hypothetical protein